MTFSRSIDSCDKENTINFGRDRVHITVFKIAFTSTVNVYYVLRIRRIEGFSSVGSVYL